MFEAESCAIGVWMECNQPEAGVGIRCQQVRGRTSPGFRSCDDGGAGSAGL